MDNDVNLNLIRTFCLIYEVQGISRAAEELQLSQPTVSYSLKQLRKTYNDQLFYRDRNLLYPTERAKKIYPDLRAALDLIRTTEIFGGEFIPEQTRRVFTLMLSDLGEVAFLPWIQKMLGQQAPQAQLRVDPLDVSLVHEKLVSGELDVAIQTPYLHSDQVERTVIFRDEYVVLARKEHPRIQGTITLEQMASERFMKVNASVGHAVPEEKILHAGQELETGIMGTRITSIPQVVMHSELLGLIPSAVIYRMGLSGQLQLLDPPGHVAPMEVSMMTRRKRRRTAPQEWFAQLIKAAVREMESEISR
ncbi:LysR family transcriptional regulator [Corynebacterium sp. A21]|uniref:LysR family transcriptional regulator n=1 Tax=Corynebacterium sp. A21 TaxID=3457318 RepID=UPI003FD05F3B